MKKSITVLGIEAEGVRGIRLVQNKSEWRVADRCFWRTDGADASADAAASEDGGAAQPGDIGDDAAGETHDRYGDLVEAFRAAGRRFGTHEVVLSVPLSSLLVKVSSVPAEDRDRLQETAAEEIGKVSPFPDEEPVAGVETVLETEGRVVSMFAALPEAAASEIGDALDEAKVRVLRTDISALGWLRTRWTEIYPEGEAVPRRKVVLMSCDDGWDVVVLDNQVPSLLRGLGGISNADDLFREVTLSLIRADASVEASEIVVFVKSAIDGGLVKRFGELAPVRVATVGGADCDDANGSGDGLAAFGGVEGVALRTSEGYSLDVTPADWAEARTEARFSKKLFTFIALAAAGWLLAMAGLFGVPFVYGRMTERQKTVSRRHSADFRAVKEMRDKVKLVQQYSDHARGSLELLKAVSDRMPEGITLTSFNFRRGERLSIVGEADQPTSVYDFKNALADAETEDGAKLFAEVNLTGPSQSRGVHKFSIECLFEAREEK
ncbi:MAG: PilN domain-containing protein [Verrucomicrobiota bacterium]|nr:PilN domain-containing protein [Verrucomicrobiota bacterium]